MYRLARVLIVLTAVALVAACGTARPSKYYTLDLPTLAPSSGGPYPVALLVGRFSAPHLYRDDRLVYRNGDVQIGTYEYHRWAEPPTDMLETMLVRSLRVSGKYQTVQRLASNTRGDYIIRGRLHRLEEVSGPPITARVTFELELYDVKTGTTVWTHYYSSEEPVNGSKVPDVVEAINRNVQRGLAESMADLERYFASNSAKK